MQDALEDIKRLGATNIIVRSVKPPDEISTQTRTFVARYGITQEDYDLFATIPTVIRMVPMRIFPKPVYHDEYMFNSRSSPPRRIPRNQQDPNNRWPFSGRQGREEMQNVCVLGSNVAAKLFPYDSPLDQAILIDKFNYVVVGVRDRAHADRRQRRQPGRRGFQ